MQQEYMWESGTSQQGVRGLSKEEVKERVAAGEVNTAPEGTDLTVGQIIRSNTLTYFNFIFLIITILLCLVGSFRNLTFLPIIIANTLIGIIQEIRAKHTLEKMRILNAPHAQVLRDDTLQKIASEKLVKDDVILLCSGDQICADAEVVSGEISVNESLLTGESDEIRKGQGDRLLSGSFVVAGEAYARLTQVGAASYIARLSKEAKTMERTEESEMIRSINLVVKWVGFIIIPVGLILFAQSYFYNEETIARSVTSAVAAVIGMIPEGLYLLTTIALALGTIRLAGRKVLLHDMKSIETLARVDVLCVDKTGTITEPGMSVSRVVWRREVLGSASSDGDAARQPLQQALAAYIDAANDHNATMDALRVYRKKTSWEGGHFHVKQIVPFSSSKKYGAIVFAEGIYLLGAPEMILRDRYAMIAHEVEHYTSRGYRVLLFAKYLENSLDENLTGSVQPLGYITLSNPIRANAKKTFSYFKSQDVSVRVISGDNPATVSEVALRAGIEGADRYVDATTLDSDDKIARAVRDSIVFGRVTPKQKQKIVGALQAAGHTVAMTGDGVNDILAMKDADCSVAMASGSDAAAQAAQVVLLDSDFAKMPEVVFEGRRVVNNVGRSASLFLVKNIFSLLMALFSAIFMITYPLEPTQIFLISVFTIGVPGFLLALEPNKERIEGGFLHTLLIKALPAGLTDALAVGALVVCGQVFSLPSEDVATAATLLLAVVGFIILVKISEPLSKLKVVIVLVNIVGMLLAGLFLPELFSLSAMSKICILLTIVFSFSAESLLRYLSLLVEKIDSKFQA